MGILIPRRRSTEIVLRLGPVSIERHRVAVADDAPTYDAYTMRFSDWVSVAAITAEGSFVLVRQHRHGIDEVTLEPAGGIIDPGEAPEETALRELIEETGYSASSIESLGWVHPNPALQTNRAFLFLARDAQLVAPELIVHVNDPHESTEAVLMTREQLAIALQNSGDSRISHALGALTLERALARTR